MKNKRTKRWTKNSSTVYHQISPLIYSQDSHAVRSITICKCVCKPWCNLVGTHEFAKFHLAKSAPGPGLVLIMGVQIRKKSYKIFEINDDLHLQHHELHYRLSTEFNFPHYAHLQGSANGLLFFRRRNDLYICNPITRDYIKLPKDQFGHVGKFESATFGFGASKVSGQHKVVAVVNGYNEKYDPLNNYGGIYAGAISTRCHVYTLGTRSWRSIAASSGDPLKYGGIYEGAFVKGNFYWLVRDANGSCLISCFDLETEVFSTFPCPRVGFGGRLCVVGNCLCFCECTSDGMMIIWLMKEYGVEKCWTKEVVIPNISSAAPDSMYPIKIFRDGDILIAPWMFYFSAKTAYNTRHDLAIFDQFMEEAIVYTPSFLSLKSFGMVESLETAAATSF